MLALKSIFNHEEERSPQPKLQKYPFIQSCSRKQKHPFSSLDKHQASYEQQRKWISKHIESACYTLECLHFLFYSLRQVLGVYCTHQRLVFTMKSSSSSSSRVFWTWFVKLLKPLNPNARKSNLWGFQSLGGIIIIIPRSYEPWYQICGNPKPSSLFTLLKIECQWVGWIQMPGMQVRPTRRSRRRRSRKGSGKRQTSSAWEVTQQRGPAWSHRLFGICNAVGSHEIFTSDNDLASDFSFSQNDVATSKERQRDTDTDRVRQRRRWRIPFLPSSTYNNLNPKPKSNTAAIASSSKECLLIIADFQNPFPNASVVVVYTLIWYF